MGFEGYREASAQLADGRWTIGYGHTRSARAGVRVSKADAKILLVYDLTEINLVLQDLMFTPLNQNQVDALSSFVFNVGVESFQSCAVLRRINEGALLQAACEIDLWRRADIQGEGMVVDALVRRRAAEKALFLTPVSGWTPAPTPVVRPMLDRDVAGVVPATRPVEVHADLTGEIATAEVIRTTASPEVLADMTPAAPIQDAGAAISDQPHPSVADSEPGLASGPEVRAEAVDDQVAHEAETSAEPARGLLHETPGETGPELIGVAELAHPSTVPNEVEHERETDSPWIHDTGDYEWRDGVVPAQAEAPVVDETRAASVIESEPPVEVAPELEPAPLGAVLDEAPTHFHPVPVALGALSLEGAAPPAEPATPIVAQPPAEPATVTAAALSLTEPLFNTRAADSGVAPGGWKAEAFRRPALFANRESVLDSPANLRTPAAAKIAGFEVETAPRGREGIAPLLLLGLFGLIVFTTAAYWTFTTRGAGGLISPLVLGAALFVIGICCVVASVYYLVHWFLGAET